MAYKRAISELLSRTAETEALRAPPRLKSRIFSTLQLEQAREGSLRSLTDTAGDGGKLCVFETLVRIAPVGEPVKSFNYW